jgi:hypothetical protein
MMRNFDIKELAAEDLRGKEEKSTKLDSAPTCQDRDWALHNINNLMVAIPTTDPGQPRLRHQEIMQDPYTRDSKWFSLMRKSLQIMLTPVNKKNRHKILIRLQMRKKRKRK